MKIDKLRGLEDSRSTRAIFSRGQAKYGVAKAPKPGNLFNVQKAAKKRLQQMRERPRL